MNECCRERRPWSVVWATTVTVKAATTVWIWVVLGAGDAVLNPDHGARSNDRAPCSLFCKLQIHGAKEASMPRPLAKSMTSWHASMLNCTHTYQYHPQMTTITKQIRFDAYLQAWLGKPSRRKGARDDAK